MIEHCYCYCLYGRDLIYYEPLKLVAQKLVNDKSAIIFVGTIEADYNFVARYYEKYTNIKIYCFGNDYKSRERLIRFLAPNHIKAKYYHYRDSDSLITDFEQNLISIYEVLHLPILILRNHPLHYSPIMAGMFSLNLEFGVKLAACVEQKLPSIESKYYYDQQFLTENLYKQYKSEALVFSSHIGYEGELLQKINFDKHNFIGQPKFWREKDCDIAFNQAHLSSSRVLVKLPFFSFINRLYQRGKFIRLLMMISKLRIWRSST